MVFGPQNIPGADQLVSIPTATRNRKLRSTIRIGLRIGQIDLLIRGEIRMQHDVEQPGRQSTGNEFRQPQVSWVHLL